MLICTFIFLFRKRKTLSQPRRLNGAWHHLAVELFLIGLSAGEECGGVVEIAPGGIVEDLVLGSIKEGFVLDAYQLLIYLLAVFKQVREESPVVFHPAKEESW